MCVDFEYRFKYGWVRRSRRSPASARPRRPPFRPPPPGRARTDVGTRRVRVRPSLSAARRSSRGPLRTPPRAPRTAASPARTPPVSSRTDSCTYKCTSSFGSQYNTVEYSTGRRRLSVSHILLTTLLRYIEVKLTVRSEPEALAVHQAATGAHCVLPRERVCRGALVRRTFDAARHVAQSVERTARSRRTPHVLAVHWICGRKKERPIFVWLMIMNICTVIHLYNGSRAIFNLVDVL